MSDLREAIKRMDSFTWAGCKDRPGPALRIVLAAARRFLALTETGPDYEAAAEAMVDSHAVDAITLGDVILAVDAALPDLTEEIE